MEEVIKAPQSLACTIILLSSHKCVTALVAFNKKNCQNKRIANSTTIFVNDNLVNLLVMLKKFD